MAAATQVAKGSARKAKPLTVKTSLNSPFSVKWNTVGGEDMHFILQILQEKFRQVGLQKIETPNRKRIRSITKRENTHKKCNNTIEETAAEKETQDAEIKQGWTNFILRKQLALGINEVTRALERNELNLVLVCKSVKPALMILHLIDLSVSRAIPACQVPRFSENIAPVLGLKSVLALGFRRTAVEFVDEVKAIARRVPSLHVPWLQCAVEQDLTAPVQGIQDTEAMEMSTHETPRCLKRKCSPTGIASEVASSSVTLQALKIKKLVPNPNKIRKPKKTKKLPSK
ncbi:ribonuclease P protein subunit p38 isoform X2 [Rhinatrema bivittatum]|nr:ribonuclease P protein subunit p38 isoform X2 [Rhinatrema bivittatum]XP_029444677.1 ribonuclease P protein subunit p38 isoform X2 [Rhinatrema bivittatum]